MADAAEVYTRPEGMSDKQEEIIQYVAKYVVASCDSAKYQQKLKAKTKYNSYFSFLDPKHPYHGHYTYLVQSYRYWMEQAKALEQTSLLSGVEGEEEYDMNLAQHNLSSGHNGAYDPYAVYESGQGIPTDTYKPHDDSIYAYPQRRDASSYAYGSDPTAPSGAAPYSSSSPAYPQQQPGPGTDPHFFSAGPEAEEEEEYEMTIQNGVQTLVPRRR